MSTCPYCQKYFAKKQLTVDHINRYHASELEQSGMDAPQALYYSVHHTLKGKCMCGCSTPTEWNYRTGKPYKVSPDPNCRKRIKDTARSNLMRARGIDQHTLMSDIQHQKDMQRNRRIAGVYQFSTDGGKIEYLAKLELSWLTFCDKIMDFPSYMIQDPPESFTYRDPKDGKEHIYMPDFYLPDYNLMVEIKSGGDHPNTNKAYMETTGYKVALKDDVMRKQTKYNYIRISGTNYGPFVETLFNIVQNQKDDKEKRKSIVVITESACADTEETMLADVAQSANTDVDVDHIQLIVGYILGTVTPKFVAITDSRYGASWYVSDMESQTIRQVSGDDEIFDCGSYRIYRYIGNKEEMVSVFRLIISYANDNELYHMWYIPEILGASAIMFDDGGSVKNNEQRRSDFIEVDQYFCTPDFDEGGEY